MRSSKPLTVTLDALRERVEASIGDTRPSISLDEAFAQVRARHAARELPRDEGAPGVAHFSILEN